MEEQTWQALGWLVEWHGSFSSAKQDKNVLLILVEKDLAREQPILNQLLSAQKKRQKSLM